MNYLFRTEIKIPTLSLALLLYLVNSANAGVPAESWVQRYNSGGSDRPVKVVLDSSNDVVVTGSINGGSQVATIKYSDSGAPLWTNDSSSLTKVTDLRLDADNNIFITGSSPDGGTVLKYSGEGVPLWTNNYAGPSAAFLGAVVDSNDDVVVVGSSDDNDQFVVKYSGDGTPLWTNYTTGVIGTAVAADGDGNLIALGMLSDYTGASTVKYSNDGEPLWTNVFLYPSAFGKFPGLAVFTNGDVAVSPPVGQKTTIKISSDGELSWTNLFYLAFGNSVTAFDDDGDVIVAGTKTSGINALMVVKYSNDGMLLWSNVFSAGAIMALAVDHDRNVIVSGTLPSRPDFGIIKFSPDGLPLSTNLYDGPSANSDRGDAVTTDGHGVIVVAGSSYESASSSQFDFVTVKYTEQENFTFSPPSIDPENGVSLNLSGYPGETWLIQRATSLDGTWTNIGTVVIQTNGGGSFQDTDLPTGSGYYRAIRQ